MGHAASQRALMDATKKRAQRLETKGQSVDFKQLLYPQRRQAARTGSAAQRGAVLSEFNKTEAGD